MSYYIQLSDTEREGPYSRDELQEKLERGEINHDTLIVAEGSTTPSRYATLAGDPNETSIGASPSPSPSRSTTAPKPRRQGIAYFLWPFNQLHRLGDIDNRSLLSLIGVGLIPMVLFTLFIRVVDRPFVFFLTALYFSVLWAILFYHIFPAPNIRISTSVYCFLGTGLVSVSLLVGFFKLPHISLPMELLRSDLPAVRASVFFLWVALPEELCKVLMVYVLSKRSEVFLPRTLAYYGMISGLGFGIYEGLDYQLDRNAAFAESEVEYLFLNLLRLTSLPVLHAVWTGVAAYLLGFAYVYPRRKILLTFVGISVPAILHALFNTFNGTLTSLGISLLSVLILILYLAKHDAFDIYLGREEYR